MAVDKKINDKKTALESALKQIEKQYGQGAIMRLGENSALNVDAVSTGSLTLDLATGIGGLPRGRIIEIYGPESSGKTTLALHCVAEAQKQGYHSLLQFAFLQIHKISISSPPMAGSNFSALRRAFCPRRRGSRIFLRRFLSRWQPSRRAPAGTPTRPFSGCPP